MNFHIPFSRVGLPIPLFVLFLVPFGQAFAVEYDITDLGEGSGIAVNDAGHAVTNRNGVAYFYDGNTVTSMGDLGTGAVSAGGLNSNDEIVGTYRPTGTPSDTSVAYYDGASWTIIGKFGGEFAYGVKINDSSVITGAYKPSGSGNRAYTYDTTTTDFTDLPDYSHGAAINADGWIAGISNNNTGSENAFYYDGTTVTYIAPLGGILGSRRGYGTDINANGEVVGYSHTATYDYHAFIYDGADVTDLGTLGGTDSEAHAVNDGGVVVGHSLDGDGVQLAFVHDGAMTDLNTLVQGADGWFLTKASDINNSGVIVGEGELYGVTHAYLLTPVVDESGVDSGASAGGAGSISWLLCIAPLILLRRKPVGTNNRGQTTVLAHSHLK